MKIFRGSLCVLAEYPISELVSPEMNACICRVRRVVSQHHQLCNIQMFLNLSCAVILLML